MKNILKEKKSEKKKLITYISPQTQEKLLLLGRRVEEVAPHLHYSVDEIVEVAIISAVKKAHRELDVADTTRTTNATGTTQTTDTTKTTDTI